MIELSDTQVFFYGIGIVILTIILYNNYIKNKLKQSTSVQMIPVPVIPPDVIKERLSRGTYIGNSMSAHTGSIVAAAY